MSSTFCTIHIPRKVKYKREYKASPRTLKYKAQERTSLERVNISGVISRPGLIHFHMVGQEYTQRGSSISLVSPSLAIPFKIENPISPSGFP